MPDAAFINENCLGCGVTYDGANINAHVDNSTITLDDCEINAIPEVETIVELPCNETAPRAHSGCPDEVRSTDMGELWAPPRACVTGGINYDFSVLNNANPSVTLTNRSQRLFSVCGECRTSALGWKTVIIGTATLDLLFVRGDGESFEGYYADWDLVMHSGDVPYTGNTFMRWNNAEQQFLDRRLIQNIPIRSCLDGCVQQLDTAIRLHVNLAHIGDSLVISANVNVNIGATLVRDGFDLFQIGA